LFGLLPHLSDFELIPDSKCVNATMHRWTGGSKDN